MISLILSMTRRLLYLSRMANKNACREKPATPVLQTMRMAAAAVQMPVSEESNEVKIVETGQRPISQSASFAAATMVFATQNVPS